jgi:hypothetical protein
MDGHRSTGKQVDSTTTPCMLDLNLPSILRTSSIRLSCRLQQSLLSFASMTPMKLLFKCRSIPAYVLGEGRKDSRSFSILS